jgi:hypothetical protein
MIQSKQAAKYTKKATTIAEKKYSVVLKSKKD